MGACPGGSFPVQSSLSRQLRARAWAQTPLRELLAEAGPSRLPRPPHVPWLSQALPRVQAVPGPLPRPVPRALSRARSQLLGNFPLVLMHISGHTVA